MQNAPRIWLDYRPVRIGWVIPDRDVVRLSLIAACNSCLWGGGFNPAILMHDRELSANLIKTFAVDLLLDVNGNADTPLALTGYHISRPRNREGWLNPAIVLGSASDFDDLALLWNLRAAGARAVFFDEAHAARLKSFANAFLETVRTRSLGKPVSINFWSRSDFSKDWKTELDVRDIQPRLCDARSNALWNNLNIAPNHPRFSLWHRDVVPSYSEAGGEPRASFALPDRPFNDDDVQSLNQKYVVVVDASQYSLSPDANRTFETPFVPQLNEFYGRNFYFDYNKARAERGRLDQGAIGIITEVSTQRLEISAFSVFEWLRAFFSACGLEIERSEPGLRCTRLISQLGNLQDCRVFKIRGVRELIRRYGVDEHFTRSAAIEVIRDVDPANGTIGFDAFKHLHIEYREGDDLKPPHVLKYLLARRVFRVGLELTCPNCELPSWMHLDDVKTNSTCPYCDQVYDVTLQLADRDWRYRRSGIFGRNDNQLGGIPVALTLQQLSSNVRERLLMYSTALKFRRGSADIEECEADFVAILAGAVRVGESPVQVLVGEGKTHQSFNTDDVRKLGKLADAIPSELARAFIMFSKSDSFTPEEVGLARTLNTRYQRRVILWSRDELEPYYAYERSAGRLGSRQHATTLTDMADNTHELFFT